jgi:divalent metal cation (Fe/Co/Zn/Cd) transporter
MARRQTPEQMIERGLKSSIIGIGFNFVLALFKCTTGFIGHSFALVADGIESLSDVVSSTVVYLGLRLSIKPPDEDHPYGHGKA